MMHMQRFWDYISSCPSISLLGILMFLLTGLYLLFLMSASNHLREKRILICILFILLSSWLVHAIILNHISPPDKTSWFSTISISLISSFELFLGDSRIFDNGFQDFLFKPDHTIWLLVLSSLYFFAVCTSSYLIVSLLFKRLNSKIWLLLHRPAKTNYIFWGLNKNTELLANDIINHISEEKQVIIIDAPSVEDTNYNNSVLERIHDIFSRVNSSSSDCLLRKATILKSSFSSTKQSEGCFFKTIGLPGLSRWFCDNYKTEVFILSENEKDNKDILNAFLIGGAHCHTVYCHANSQRGSHETLEDYYRRKYHINVRFIDTSHLAIQSLLKDEQYFSFQPVHYVDLAQENNHSLGYVESSFVSLVVGFGEFGQRAAEYAYEYGTFVGKDFSRSPFICHVFDPNCEKLVDHYSITHPGMEIQQHFSFHSIEAGTSEFWECFTKIAPTINYILLCTNNDELNLALAEDILAVLQGGQKLALLVRQSKSNLDQEFRSKELKEKYKDSFATFGEQKRIWTYNNITNVALESQAKSFFEQYILCSGGTQKWEDRERQIYLGDPKSIRQQSQDYANVLHLHTKKTLLGNDASIFSLLEKGINSGDEFNKNKEHFTTTPSEQSKRLENLGLYLAIGEHLRWQSSHAVLGYSYGELTDDSKKKHAYMIPFGMLSKVIQHYDWLVIKTSLRLINHDYITTSQKANRDEKEAYD